MNDAERIARFNQALDHALGLGADEPGSSASESKTEELLAVAARLAETTFAAEARPSPALRAQVAAAGRPASPRRRPLFAGRWTAPALIGLGILLIVAGLVAAGPALAAVGRWLGYLPGVGRIEDTIGLRVMAEPVALEREGIRLRVTQAVASADETILLLRVEGLSLTAANSQGESAPTGSVLLLRLPDGGMLPQVGGEMQGWGSGYEARMTFAALPPGVQTVTLEIPRLLTMPAGAAPENWQVSLRFVAAPPDMVMLPIIELATPTPAVTLDSATAAPAAALYGIRLHVEQLVPAEPGYLLYGSLEWDARYPAENGAIANGVRLVDANGQDVPVEWDTWPGNNGAAYRGTWSLRTAPIYAAGPATLTLDSVRIQLPEAVIFTFDPGPDPQEGQTWDVDQEVQVLGFPVHVGAARYVRVGDLRGFEFELDTDPALLGLDLNLIDQRGGSSGGGSHREENGHILSVAVTDMALGGPMRFGLYSAVLRGPWSASFTPPAGGQPAVTATPAVEPCLTLAGWQELVAGGPVPLPAGIGGRVVGAASLGSRQESMVYTANVDGSDLHEIGEGTWPALSPDGTQVVYSGEDGLYLAGAQDGPGTRLPGTQANDYHALWSPDGQQIAFIRVADLNLYVMNADGSGLHPVTSGVDYEQLVGWSPDGARLYFAQMTSGSQQMLKALDLSSGEIEDLFSLAQRGVPVVAPDGAHLAFADSLFGKMGGGLFVSRPDGSERRLVAQLEHWGVTPGVWSPDGQWLLISVYDADQFSGGALYALLQPDTCQVVPLPALPGLGLVQGWGP